MPLAVLSTKLFAPPLRPNCVNRSRLVQRMETGAQQGRRLTLVSAPAGFGKTTLISEWIEAAGSRRKAVWISMDAEDSDPAQVLQMLVTAFKPVDEAIGSSVQAALQSRQPPALGQLIGLLINDIAASEKEILLVLDDFHLVHSPEVQQIIELLLDRQPRSLHTVILSREDPPLPLPRLRARGQITEIRERDLRFNPEEAQLFFHQTMCLNLDTQAVQTLAARTEGWIAGMQLAAIALQEAPNSSSVQQFIDTFAGSDRYIVDYLVSEVLNSQPERIREFLMKTSILDRLCGPLCDAVLGTEAGAESQDVLLTLEQMNMFIIPLDNQRQWYRYHHLFGELLRLRLARRGEEGVRPLDQRAAEWLGAQGLIDEAVQHALAAKNPGFAADLVNRNWRQAQHEGRPKVALKWIEMMPKEWVSSSALLSAAKAWTMYLLGRTDAVLPAVEDANRAFAVLEAEGRLPKDDFEYYSLPGQMAALQALIALRKGDVEKGRAYAREAIRIAPPQDVLSLGLSWSALAGTYREEGNLEEAVPCYYQAVEKNTLSGNIIAVTIGGRHLGRTLQAQGKLRETEDLYHSILKHAEEKGQLHLPAYGMMQVALAEIYYEYNQLDKARSFLDSGLALGRPGGALDLLVAAAILEARLRKAAGDLPSALAALQEIYETVRKADEPMVEADVASWLPRLQAELGDRASLQAWAERPAATKVAASGLMGWLIQFSQVRLCNGLGHWEEALALAQDLETRAQAAKSFGRQIEAFILQAESLWQLDRKEQALDCLAQALALAEPRGYQRIFLDEGASLQPLLVALLKGPRLPAGQKPYAVQLLAGFPSAGERTPVEAAAAGTRPPELVDPLSEREIEVLRLLAQGQTLAEIAKQLYLSPNTLKAHTQNIYSKLDVHSRVEVVNKARELGYLP